MNSRRDWRLPAIWLVLFLISIATRTYVALSDDRPQTPGPNDANASHGPGSSAVYTIVCDDVVRRHRTPS